MPATLFLGYLAHSEGRWDEAREWYRKALAMAPQNANLWCRIGALAWMQWLRDRKPAHGPNFEEALSDIQKSIALDPRHEDAMRYLSMLLRERAEMRDRVEDKRADLAASDRWMQQAEDVRADRVQAEIAATVEYPFAVDDPDAFLQQMALAAGDSPRPPPPAPLPQPLDQNGRPFGALPDHAVVTFEPVGSGPAPTRVAPAVQARKLIAKVDPEFLDGTGTEAPMRYVVVIGRDGRVAREFKISGNPWLEQTAIKALRGWLYEPTLVNGKAVEVVTEVRVEFQRGNSPRMD